MMKLKFNGLKVKQKSGGCGCRGTKTHNSSLLTIKTFTLLSGGVLHCRAGNIYEVSNEDGRNLLTYAGAFTEVK